MRARENKVKCHKLTSYVPIKFSEFDMCSHNSCLCLVFGVIADSLFYL